MNCSGSGSIKNPEGSAGVYRNDNSNPQQGSGSNTAKMIPSASSASSAASDEAVTTSAKITNAKATNNNGKTPPNKKDSRKLFVGGLPSDVTDKEFREFFAQYGVVLDSVVMYDRETHRSRGFGFVTFQDPDVANRLLNMGQNTKEKPIMEPRIGRLEMRGKTCEVKAAEPKESRPTRRSYAPPGASFHAAGGARFVDHTLSHHRPLKIFNNEERPSPAQMNVGPGGDASMATADADSSGDGAGAGATGAVLVGAHPAAAVGYHHHHQFPHDISGASPNVNGYHGQAAFHAGVRHNMGPVYNNPMRPVHGEMMPHHPGVAAPFVGNHMDGTGYVDFSVEGYQAYHQHHQHHQHHHQHHLPPHHHHHQYWLMMQQQQHQPHHHHHMHQPPLHQQPLHHLPLAPPQPNAPQQHAIYNNNHMSYPAVSTGTAPSAAHTQQSSPPATHDIESVDKQENGTSSA